MQVVSGHFVDCFSCITHCNINTLSQEILPFLNHHSSYLGVIICIDALFEIRNIKLVYTCSQQVGPENMFNKREWSDSYTVYDTSCQPDDILLPVQISNVKLTGSCRITIFIGKLIGEN